MTDFNSLYELSSEQRNALDTEGYLLLTDVLRPEEVALIQQWSSEVKAWPNRKGEHMHYEELRPDGTTGHFRTENYADYHAGFNSLFRGQRLSGIMAQVFGEEARLFKEKINYKEPGGSRGFAAHIDSRAYNHVGAVNHMTFLIAVDDMTITNGCLEAVPGSHKVEIPTNETGRGIDATWEKQQKWVPLPMKAGGMMLFGSYLCHRSSPNHSSGSRKAIYATYNGISEGDQHTNYYTHRRQHFPPPSEREPGKDYSLGNSIYSGSRVTAGGQYLGGGPVDLKIDTLFQLLKDQGGDRYEKKNIDSVTQLEHAIQAGELARQSGADDNLIVAALLHDVGHFIPYPDAVQLMENGKNVGRKSHDAIGQVYLLEMGFPKTVADLVGGHVDAKRYLTAVDTNYMNTLSTGSVSSLKHQGGPFTSDQVTEFEKDPLHKQKAQIRIWDDGAKRHDIAMPDLDSFRPCVQRVLTGGA